MSGANNANWYVMLSDLAAPAAFDEHAAVVRWVTGAGDFGVLQVGHGDTYENLGIDGVRLLPQTDRWHNFWLVLNADTSAGASWSLYWQGPSDTLPQGPLALLDDPDVSAFEFWRQPDSPIQTISIGTILDYSGGASSLDYWIIDDIYVSDGLDLTTAEPAQPTPCDEYVDTGSFLGWIYLQCDGWVYSETLGWLFISEEHLTATGGWVFMPR